MHVEVLHDVRSSGGAEAMTFLLAHEESLDVGRQTLWSP
jgi:hypothetical protein